MSFKNLKTRKSWREKLEKALQPNLVDISEKWDNRIGHGKMLVPSPLLVDSVICKIQKGKLATVNNIRDYFNFLRLKVIKYRIKRIIS